MPRRKSTPKKEKALTTGRKKTRQMHIEMWIDVPVSENPHPVHWNWKEISGYEPVFQVIRDVPESERITKDGKQTQENG